MTINANAHIPSRPCPARSTRPWPPGAATPPHRQDCEEEVVAVTTGSGEVHMQGKVLPFGPDSTLVIPPNVDHQIFNTGSEPMTMVASFSVSPVVVKFPDGTAIELPWRT